MSVVRPRRVAFLFALAFCLVAIGGCSGGGSSNTVSGTVTLDGTPLKSGAVNFYPDSSKGNKDGQIYVGAINEQGQYSLAGGGKEGAPAGWYKVTVNSSVPSNPKDPYSIPRSVVNFKYRDISVTDLGIEVKKGAAPGSYDLKVTR